MLKRQIMKIETATSARFELTRAEPSRFRIYRLNHSAKVPLLMNQHSNPECNRCASNPHLDTAPDCCWNASASSVKIGTIQRRLAWPLRKDDTAKIEKVSLFGIQIQKLLVGESNPGRLRDRQKCYQLHQRGSLLIHNNDGTPSWLRYPVILKRSCTGGNT